MRKTCYSVTIHNGWSLVKYLIMLKLIAAISFLLSFQAFAVTGMGQKTINLDLKDVRVEAVLKQIELQGAYRFVYKNEILPQSKLVSVHARNASLDYVMKQTLKNTGISYKIMKENLVVLVKTAVEESAVNVTGTVRDNEGNPLDGVSIVEKGTTNGTISNSDGKFTISVKDNTAMLVFSYTGYLSTEAAISTSGTDMQVVLTKATNNLDEVVIIGYGSRAKKDITTAVSNINSETISKSVSLSAENAMQGTMSGVFVTSSGGNPIDKPVIRIRGTNTWGDADPLFVVDGVVIGRGAVGYTINPADIESISVLKDASSAAIYGVQAANGVVLITTKKGKNGPPVINFNSRYGFSNTYQELDWLTTPQLVAQVQKSYASNPEITVSDDNKGLFDPNSPRYVGNKPTYNWQDAIRTKNAPMQDYNLSMSGGTERTDYYVSLGYSKTVGTILHNFLGRYSGTVKLNTKINNWLKTGINYRITSINQFDVWNAKDYFDMGKYPAWQPIYQDEANGINGYKGYAYAIEGFLPDGSYSLKKLYGEATRVNLLGQGGTADEHTNKGLRNMGSIYVELTPLKGLSLKGQLNMDANNAYAISLTDYDRFPFDYTSGDPRTRGGGKSVGLYESTINRGYGQSEEFTGNYIRTFGDHHIDVLYNFSHQHGKAFYESAESEYMASKKPNLRWVNADKQYTNLKTSGTVSDLMGHLFRATYNYASRYYLDATVRRDASYRFAPHNRWGTFPGVSAAWRITNEPFIKNTGINWINDFKFRAGWGQLGNGAIPGEDMPFLSTLYLTPSYSFGDEDSNPAYVGAGSYNIGAAPFSIPNPDLTWERNTTTNFGFDAVLFKHLSFSAEYYSKLTNGILQQIALPTSAGLIISPSMNIAKVSNKGFEFNANYQNSINASFTYNIGANLTTIKNKVLETYKHIPLSNIEEGHSMFYNKAYVVAGVFQTDQEAQEYHSKIDDANVQKSKVGAGDFYFKDLRGAPKKEGEFYSDGPDGKIDNYDMVDVGNTIPGFFYGFNFGIDYKGLTLSTQFTGVGNVTRYNSVKAGTWFATTGQNTTHIIDNAWTPDRPSNTYSRLVLGDPTGNQRNSTFFYESGAYLRLQNLQLGYTLPQRFYNTLRNNVKNVYIYLGGSNLFIVTKYTGLDPENDVYPMARTVFAGLNIKF